MARKSKSSKGLLRSSPGIRALALVALACGGGDGDGLGSGPGTFAAISIDPGAVTLAVGGTQSFVASCVSTTNQPIACPDLNWSAGGGTRQSTSGSPDTAGTYTAGNSTGNFTITASFGTASTSAPITIIPSGPISPNVTVIPGQTNQTFQGWEATIGQSPTYTGLSAAGRDTLIKLAVKDLGLNRLRNGVLGSAISPSPGVYDFASFDYIISNFVLPIKAAVEAQGETFILDLQYDGGGAPAFQTATPQGYAAFAINVLLHVKTTFNLEPEFWAIRNEPDKEANSNSCISASNPTPRQTALSVGQSLKALGDSARAHNLNKVKFSVPSVECPRNAIPYMDTIQTVTGATQYLGELAYHRYGGAPTAGILTAIRDRAATLGIQTAMLESIPADQAELYDDLTLANVSAWQKYVLLTTPSASQGGTLYLLDSGTGRIYPNTSTPFLRQYYRYVRGGMVRVDAVSQAGALKPTAYKDAQGRIVVVVNASSGGTIAIQGLPAATYGVSFSTSSFSGVEASPITIVGGQTLVTSIPASGVLTVYPKSRPFP